MFFVAVSFLLLIVLAGAVALVLFGRYRPVDLLVFAVLASLAVYLSRFNPYLSLSIKGLTFTTLFWYLLLIAVGLLILRLFVPNRTSLRCGWIVVLLLAFTFLAILSGVINGGVEGVVAAVHVVAHALVPMLVGWLLVDIMRREVATSRRMRTTFILLLGVLIPLITLTSSLAPGQLASLLGWSDVSASRSFGFVRGWSPIGSAAATGLLMVIAYGFAMHEVIDNRRRIFIPVLVLVGLAILFMLARAVLVMFLLFHVLYFWSAIRRKPMRVVGLALLASVVMTPVMFELFDRFSFERFTSTQDRSVDIRASSAIAALEASFERPFLGHGPGLLYEELRVDGARVAGSVSQKHTYVGNRLSALEPHDLYLLLAAEHGWPAAGLFFAAMLLIWNRCRAGRMLLADQHKPMSVTLSALWVSVLAMFLTHSGPMVNPQASVFLWFFAFYGMHWRATVGRVETAAVSQPAPAAPRSHWGVRPAVLS